MTDCRNCAETLPDGAGFCSACGQSTRVFTRPWLEVSRELLSELFDFDGRMLVSLRLLLTRPGRLADEFNRGRRAAYTSPLRMYLLISLLFFFVLPLILPDVTGTSSDHDFSVELYSRGMFILLPVYSLLLKMFYRKTYYLAHLVFTTYLFSAMFIVFALMLSIEAAADRYLAVMLLQVAMLLYMAAYFVISIRVCYHESWLKSSLKAFGLLAIFLPVLAGSIELARVDFQVRREHGGQTFAGQLPLVTARWQV
jgi:hypothetical protein